MAEYIAEGAARIEGMEIKIVSEEEAKPSDVLECDGIAVGSPTNMGTISWKLKKFFDEVLGPEWGKVDGKIGCAFSTSGGWGGGAELTCQTINNILINFGFLTFGVPDYVDETHTLHYGATIIKEPREEYAIESCRRLGQRLAEWCSVYFDQQDQNHPLKTRKKIIPD